MEHMVGHKGGAFLLHVQTAPHHIRIGSATHPHRLRNISPSHPHHVFEQFDSLSLIQSFEQTGGHKGVL